MSEISRVSLFGKLNPLVYKTIEGATVFCKLRGNPYVELVHWMTQLLENNASFFGAQMSAMDNATRNAGEMIKKLTLNYNRQRQAQITKELIEIISGAEAL